MTWLQFRVLYREFLFRVVDLELLSTHAEGDASKILGQFASLLVLFGTWVAWAVLGVGDARMPRGELLIAAWGLEHFLISTTMLVVGLFAVLSWDSTFPDRRDALVLAPLPVPMRTVFIAKVAASATALACAVLSINGLASLTWTLATAPSGDGILALIFSPQPYRSFAAYVTTMISAGVFVYGALLCVQGAAAQFLSRRQFLRVSALLQMAAFCLLVSGYFLQPHWTTPEMLAAPANQRTLGWLPSYWFLGLLQQLNGSMHDAMVPLARRAWLALAITVAGAAAVFTLSYLRTLRRIVEEPAITPTSSGGAWLPNFGSAFETAVTQFSLRTLLRSRQHRLILAFYLGVGFAITVLFLKTPAAQRQLATPHGHLSGSLIAASIVLACAWVVGMRVVFSLPVDLRANWIFRLTPIQGAPACLAARRRAFVVLALVPICASSSALFFALWPWRPAAGHVVILALLAVALIEVFLHGVQRILFTCSYLPGKSNFHITFWLCIGLLMILISKGAEFERRALTDPTRYAVILAALGGVAIFARWWMVAEARAEGAEVQFEDEPPPVIAGLGLHRDGAPIELGS